MTKKAALLMADGVEEIEATVPYDLLTRAGIHTDLVSVDDKDSVKGNMGMNYTNLLPLTGYDFTDVDVLVLPGGDGYVHLKDSEAVQKQIKAFADDPNKTLAAICAASSILGEDGLYKGRKYTVVPPLNGDFGGKFEHKHAVIDGNIVTGISVGGAFQFAFDIIRHVLGKEAADKLKKETCYTL